MQKDWKTILTKEEFFVCREKGTEPAFSGNYDKLYELEHITVNAAKINFLSLMQSLIQDLVGQVLQHQPQKKI